MRALLGVAGLLFALAVVGLLLKKQLATSQTPSLSAPAQSSGSVQQTYQRAVEAAIQTPRPVSEDQ